MSDVRINHLLIMRGLGRVNNFSLIMSLYLAYYKFFMNMIYTLCIYTHTIYTLLIRLKYQMICLQSWYGIIYANL